MMLNPFFYCIDFILKTYVTHPAGAKKLNKWSGTFASSAASFITVSLTVNPVDSPPDT